MLSVGPVILAIRALTLICWGVAIYAAIPFGPSVPEDSGRLAIAGAIVGTCKYISSRTAKPAHEIFEVGKAMGRAELLREQAAGDGVVSLEDRRRAQPRRGLTKVSGGAPLA